MKKADKSGIRIVYAVPIYLTMLVPFVVYGKIVNTGIENYPWFANSTQVLDFFLYYKKNTVIIISGLILFFSIVKALNNHFGQKVNSFEGRFLVFLPFAAYVILSIISSLFSPYKDYACKGMMEQFESIWVIAGYFLICVYSYTIYYREMFIVFGFSTALIGAIGTLQFWGIDIYRMKLFQKFFMPQSMQEIPFHFNAESGRTYCTFSNPNYVGMFCCLVIPVLTVLTFHAKSRLEKILYGVSNVMMICSLVGSHSKSGILVCVVCMLLLLVVCRKQIASKVRYLSKGSIVSMVFVIVVISSMIVRHRGSFIESFYDIINRKNEPETNINEIGTYNNTVKIVYDSRELFFDIDYDKSSLKDTIKIVDEFGNPYSVSERQGVLYFEEEELLQLTTSLVQYGDYVAIQIGDGNLYWYFTDQTPDHTWYYLTSYGKPDKLISNEVDVYRGLNGLEHIVSGRGYIWSRTIPLLKKNILIGSGQNCFMMVFPNNDYLGMAKWGYKGKIITKPHCMYMQIAVESGMLSLVVLIAFWCCFFVKVISNKSKYTLLKAIAIGILGYLLTGITNDSNVGVAPIFWMLIGIGFRLCYDKEELL